MIYFFVVDLRDDVDLFAFVSQHLGELSDRNIMIRVRRIIYDTDGLCIIQISDGPRRPRAPTLPEYTLIKAISDTV